MADTTPAQTELEACPFCGQPPRYLEAKAGFYTERVICDHCGFHLSPEMWQARALLSQPSPAQDEALHEQNLWLHQLFDLLTKWNGVRDGTPSKADAFHALWKHAHNIGPHWRARAYLAGKDEAAPPEGYKLVPIEPTPEMVDAYLKANTAYWERMDQQAAASCQMAKRNATGGNCGELPRHDRSR
jgi:hypothetical protein